MYIICMFSYVCYNDGDCKQNSSASAKPPGKFSVQPTYLLRGRIVQTGRVLVSVHVGTPVDTIVF